MTTVPSHFPRDLGHGLVLRFAAPEDAEPLAQFNGRVHGEGGFNELVADWTRDFMSLQHPTCGPSNVTLVEDARAGGRIVSSMCLIPQTWTYAGIPFGVGRPEAVGTDPDHRRRGLVRAQFDALHAKSEAMGHLVQGITGIPWYYRQFGYEYALELEAGRLAYLGNLPALKEGEAEPYRLRPMALADLPLAMPLYERQCSRQLVACPRTEAIWRGLLTGYHPGSLLPTFSHVVESRDGEAVGYLRFTPELWGGMFPVHELEIVEGRSSRAIMPSVLRAVKSRAEAEATVQKKDVSALLLQLGTEHPAYEAVPELLPTAHTPYAWYLRVPDVPGFLRHIAPALESRLARSAMAGHTGELRVSEYTGGFGIAFERGKIAAVEPWKAPQASGENAAFPPRVFLQLLFGYRSLADIRRAYPDCWAKPDATVLLNDLFPRQASQVIPVS